MFGLRERQTETIFSPLALVVGVRPCSSLACFSQRTSWLIAEQRGSWPLEPEGKSLEAPEGITSGLGHPPPSGRGILFRRTFYKFCYVLFPQLRIRGRAESTGSGRRAASRHRGARRGHLLPVAVPPKSGAGFSCPLEWRRCTAFARPNVRLGCATIIYYTGHHLC